MSQKTEKLNGTTLVHGDAKDVANNGPEVGPSISVSTSELWGGFLGQGLTNIVAFRQPNPVDNVAGSLSSSSVDFRNPTRHVYSRYTQQVSTRAEHILSQINVSR